MPYIPTHIPTYIHDPSRISIDCLTPASRLRRSAWVWIILTMHWELCAYSMNSEGKQQARNGYWIMQYLYHICETFAISASFLLLIFSWNHAQLAEARISRHGSQRPRARQAYFPPKLAIGTHCRFSKEANKLVYSIESWQIWNASKTRSWNQRLASGI